MELVTTTCGGKSSFDLASYPAIYPDTQRNLICMSGLHYNEDNSEIRSDLNESVKVLNDLFQIISFRDVKTKQNLT